MRTPAVVTALLFSVAAIGHALAAPITVDLIAPTKTHPGSTFAVDVNVTGLRSAGLVLAGFSFDLIFTSALVDFMPLQSSFGASLGLPDVDAVTSVQTTPLTLSLTSISAAEVSFLSGPELAALQADSFPLFTAVFFVPSTSGGSVNSTLSFIARDFVLSDEFGNQIVPDQTLVATASVLLAPEPATLTLVMVAYAFFIISRRRRRA
jgi:hypothetical protein